MDSAGAVVLAARGASGVVATDVGTAWVLVATALLGTSAEVAGDGGAVVVDGDALVGVVVCGAVDVVAVVGDGVVVGEVLVGEVLVGVVSVVVDVAGDDGAPGVLVGSTAGTSAAEDGGTV